VWHTVGIKQKTVIRNMDDHNRVCSKRVRYFKKKSTRRCLASLVVAMAVAFVGCARPKPPAPALNEQPRVSPDARNGFAPGEITQDMPPSEPQVLVRAQFPTALQVSQDRRLFFTDRAGRLWVAGPLDGGGKDPGVALVHELPVSTAGERGLLGLALHPDFPKTPFIYVFASPSSNLVISQIHRLTVERSKVVSDEVIIEVPAGPGCCHKGGRLSFGPDRKLYVTVGENLVPPAAQDEEDWRGKILRYNDDGTVPDDNPFGPGNPVWALGLRNSFGLTFSPDGVAFSTDNGPSGGDGPSCCDEVNRIEPGGNYGWPDSFGSRYKGGIKPIWHSGDRAVVPTGITVVSSPRFGALSGALAFCTFVDRRMFVIDQKGKAWENGLAIKGIGPDGCTLDITQGPDGRLYFSSYDTIFVWG
jgi:glucose/arabinose dehydrogenase